MESIKGSNSKEKIRQIYKWLKVYKWLKAIGKKGRKSNNAHNVFEILFAYMLYSRMRSIVLPWIANSAPVKIVSLFDVMFYDLT